MEDNKAIIERIKSHEVELTPQIKNRYGGFENTYVIDSSDRLILITGLYVKKRLKAVKTGFLSRKWVETQAIYSIRGVWVEDGVPKGIYYDTAIYRLIEFDMLMDWKKKYDKIKRHIKILENYEQEIKE